MSVLLILFENEHNNQWEYSQMKNGKSWTTWWGVLQGRLQTTFHPRDSWWWAGSSSWWWCEDNDEDVAREAPNNIQFSQFYFHMQSLTSREVSGPPQEMVRKTGSSSSSWGSINPDSTFISTLPLSLPWEFSLMCPSKGHWCQPKRQWWIHWLALCSQVGSPPGCSPTASGDLTSLLGLLLPKNEIKVK